jgi:hypothetical protein
MSQPSPIAPSRGRTADEATGLKSGIYRIRCLANGKVYIGSAVKIAKRWRDHIQVLVNNQHHSSHLQRAWNKYGPEAFAFEVIEWVEVARLIEREQAHIDAVQAARRSHGFNSNPTAGSRLGATLCEESRRKIGEASRGRTASAETRRKISEANLGRKMSEENKQKLIACRLGKPLSEETRRKLSNANLGKNHSDEVRRKLREFHRGRKPGEECMRKAWETNHGKTRTKEEKQRLREANLGKTHSEETRQKMRESQRRRREREKEQPLPSVA